MEISTADIKVGTRVSYNRAHPGVSFRGEILIPMHFTYEEATVEEILPYNHTIGVPHYWVRKEDGSTDCISMSAIEMILD